jgi:hypothetical protein
MSVDATERGERGGKAARRSVRRRRGKVGRREEGIVILVVMLILMLFTTTAAVSIRGTQSEVEASGQEKLSMQTEAVAEIAIVTTTTWIDQLGDANMWLDLWSRADTLPLPIMSVYGEPNIATDPAMRHHAMRTVATQQMDLLRTNLEVPPLTQPVATGTGGGGGGGGGSGGSLSFDDQLGIGSFGPRQAYGLARDTATTLGYVVDITDCAQAPPTLAPGSPIGGGPGSLKIVQFYCVLTAHGRMQLPGNPITRPWTFGGATYNQDVFMSAHDARATILTPEMLVAGQ